MKKVGFLFGAGAEISYGMPSGGQFALDIFRYPTNESKNKLREMIKGVDKYSDYASHGLPENFDAKNISAYGKQVFKGIIRDTIRNNKDQIIDNLNNFDSLAENSVREINITDKDSNNEDQIDILDEQIKKELGKNINVNQLLKYTDLFKKGNRLFDNKYFASLLLYYKNYTFENPDEKALLGELIKSMLQLQIGALSSNISSNVEDSVFEKDNLQLDIFDDLGGSLNVNYETAGVEGLNLLSEQKIKKDSHPIVKLAYKIAENLYSGVLNYKSLIDSNWQYLYSPKNEWAKFSKIIVFLYTVQDYIMKQAENLDKNKPGYYTDLKEEIKNNNIDVNVVGTTNYSSFIEKILPKEDIFYLNGGIDVYYDPYMNSLVNKTDNDLGHIIVPLMFTQSGTKPMTSIDMSEKYVSFYENLKNVDKICAIGFGFNLDDEHINGIIRTLIERDNKQLYIISVDNDTSVNLRKKYTRKLRVSKDKNIHIVVVNSQSRKDGNGNMWYKSIEA